MNRKREKDDSEIYDERDSTRNSYENIENFSHQLLQDFQYGIRNALSSGNVHGVECNLAFAEDPRNQDQFIKEDVIKLTQYIEEARAKMSKMRLSF